MNKGILVGGTTIGSVIGAYVPALWGDDSGLSFISLCLGTIGGIVGLWIGYKFSQYLED